VLINNILISSSLTILFIAVFILILKVHRLNESLKELKKGEGANDNKS